MTTAQTQQKLTYTIDPSHSSVEFVARHMMLTKVRGRFASFQGQLDLAPGSDVPEAFSASIEAASIDTREAQRDTHLKSADFFDVEKYPVLTFETTRIEGTPDAFKAYGNLTIHGVTKEVALNGTFEGRGTDPWGNQRVGYSASTTISRKDFGLTYNAALETGGVLVSDEIRIELNVQALVQK